MTMLLFITLGNNIPLFYKILCDTLTKCILFFYEKKILKNIISYNYFYFDNIESKQILDECLDLVVSDDEIYKEKYESINILHLYVNSKESLVDYIHLVYVNKESILLDKNKNIIQTDDKLFDAKYLSDISFSSNDYSLNALLNLLPKKLYIHLANNYEDEFIIL